MRHYSPDRRYEAMTVCAERLGGLIEPPNHFKPISAAYFFPFFQLIARSFLAAISTVSNSPATMASRI